MDAAVYQLMQQVEDEHWWFVGRRNIVRDAIARLPLRHEGARPRILDAGCGTGGNLPMLAEFGSVKGMEFDPSAAAMARARGPWSIERGALPDDLPFGDERFDLVTLTDVLEHIDDDEGALRALAARVAPSGRLLLTVPAFQFLWSAHDTWHHHKRRYTAGSLRAVAERAGLAIERISYFNFWLFPAVTAVRLASRAFGSKAHGEGLSVPPRPINTALTALFSSESALMRVGRLPFGVSILAVARAGES